MSDPIDIFEQAADYCAKLAAVEHAHILGDEQEIDILLTGVDPIDARHVANVLRILARNLRGGTKDVPRSPRQGSGSSPGVSAAMSSSDFDEQPSAPAIYPQVTHIGDNWSRRVPCQ